MRDIPRGMLAGLVATIVLSVLMVLKAMMGLMPQLDIAKMIAGMMGSPATPLIGWIVHFAIGIVVYGVAIAVLDSKLPGTSHVGHGVMLGVIGWRAEAKVVIGTWRLHFNAVRPHSSLNYLNPLEFKQHQPIHH